MNRFRFWYNAARPSALPQSVMPAVMAICIAAANAEWQGLFARPEEGVFSLPLSILALLGIACAHLSVDLFDDYFDYKNAGIESRQKLARAGMRARLGKAQYLADGQATLKQTALVASLFAVVALACGIVCLWFRGWGILLIAAIAAFLGFFYSAPPFKLCYHGLGELLTGVMFGPLLVAGMCVVGCGFLPKGIWLVSVAIGMLVVNILYVHSIMDCEPDRSVGKQTLATLLKNPVPQLAFCFLFIFVPFALVLLAVLLGYFNGWTLLVFLTLPMGIYLFRLMVRYCEEVSHHQPPTKVQPRWWMGPMQRWEMIEKGGIDWFMIRWYLARNMITFFVVIIAIAAFF